MWYCFNHFKFRHRLTIKDNFIDLKKLTNSISSLSEELQENDKGIFYVEKTGFFCSIYFHFFISVIVIIVW